MNFEEVSERVLEQFSFFFVCTVDSEDWLSQKKTDSQFDARFNMGTLMQRYVFFLKIAGFDRAHSYLYGTPPCLV